MDKTPIYKYPASYARENNQLPQYRASMQSLARCKAAIEAAITEQWDGMNVPSDAAKGVLKEFGTEKVALVLAYTVQELEHDRRISGHNRDWAKTVPKYSLLPENSDIRITSHPAKLDIFLDVAQKNILEVEQEKKQSRANTRRPSVKRGAEKQEKIPVYRQNFDYAQAHDEIEMYHASTKVNTACKEAIEAAIREHYADNRLDSVHAVQEVAKQFGYDRMLYVLANTVQSMDWDGRVSRSNKDWARTVPLAEGKPDRYCLITRSHPGVLNLFVNEARHQHLLSLPLKAADIKDEAAHILKRFQEAQEPNSPNGTHFMVQVSPDFLARAKTKDTDRLIAMLPFASLSLSGLNDRKGVYALITKDEDRNKSLVLRKPSVRKKLQEPSAAPVQSAKKKHQDQER